MKYLLLFALLCCDWRCCQAQEAKGYPVTVHVISSHGSGGWQTLETQINGAYYELAGPIGKHGRLDKGDYPGRLLKNEHQFNESTVVYELLLAKNTTRKFTVSGQTRLAAVFIPMEAGDNDSGRGKVARSQTSSQLELKKRN